MVECLVLALGIVWIIDSIMSYNLVIEPSQWVITCPIYTLVGIWLTEGEVTEATELVCC